MQDSEDQDDYDSPWKNIIQVAFPEFIAFYFPHADAQIDWPRGHAFLEQELRQVLPEAELGKRVVDALVRVYLLNGTQSDICIHIEVQSSRDAEFAERMFTCNARLYERYQRPVASFAVLADHSRTWKPDHFVVSILGCTHRLDFPVAKLNDYAARLDMLPTDPNPFGVITAAHIHTRNTRGNPGQRFAFKRQLLLLVIEHHADRPRIAGILKALDWMMRLPKDINLNLWQEINTMTNKRKEWLTPPEIWAMEEMARERAAALAEGESTLLRKQLTLRFGPLSEEVLARLASANTDQLEHWAERILDARTLDSVFGNN